MRSDCSALAGICRSAHIESKLWLRTAVMCLAALLLPSLLAAQNYVYVNNRTATGNTISGFAVDAGGVLTAVPGSPFSTGGAGANILCSAVDRITVSPSRNLLFVSNSGDQTVSVFQIAPATGTLTAVVGSPFATGLTLDSCAGMSLAATPNGNFLMVSSNGTINTYNVGVNGALSLASSISGLPTPMAGMKISGDGRFLAVAHQSSVSVFTIGATGALTAVPGSPFIKGGTGLLSGLEFSCDGSVLYGGEGGAATSITDAWTVGVDGSLTQILGAPFGAAGTDSNVVFLTPDNTLLFQSDQGSNDLNSFTINPDGTLTSIGLFGGAGQTHLPAGLASDNSGLFLYAADDAFGVAVFNIIPGVIPTLVADNPITGAGQIQGVAAYPPRSCARTDFSITQTATPNPVTAGNQITYNITVTNNGPSTASVAINDLLPKTSMTFVSCTAGPGGVCDKGNGLNRGVTFASLASGQSGTATIVGATLSTLLNGDTISNTAITSNSSAVDTNPVNNSALTDVTVSAPLSPTNFIVSNSAGSYFGTTTLTTTLHRTLNGNAVAGRNITFSLNGIVVGTAITNATGVATLPNVPLILNGIPINAGTYLTGIGVSFAGDTQYQASSATSTLTVNKDVLTVTAQNATKVYGDANPPFTYVITGFVNNETVAVVSGTASCTSSANLNSSAGTAPIQCSVGTLAATNYSFVFVPATLTITPAPLTLAGNSVSRLYGDANPALTGTVVGLKAGDQATATFSVSAVSTSAVGTYPLIGTVVPGSSFLASDYTITTTGALTITPAPLTATAANATRLYGDPNPTFTGTITGVKNGDAVTATFTSAADPTSPVGTYPITATLTGSPTVVSNYTVSTTGATLTITPAALSVSAANASRLYGDANPVFTGTITGIKNADNITATYASAAVATSSVGAYPIVPTLVDPTAKLTNYTVTSNNGSLTVSPAPLAVAAANTTRLYGDANPVFTGTITGIKNGDNITATYASVADPTSPVGTFAIVPTLVDPTLKLSNYSVLSSSGVLTVAPAPLTVSGANATRLYGDANPAFTGTIAGLKNGDNITATFASAATLTSPVASYPIVPTLVDPTAKLGNYSVISNNGTLIVAAAPLTVTSANASRLYGDPDPAFTGTITGLKNGDNITATFASTATAASAVGSYPITATLVDPTSKLGNYSVVSNNGTLTVSPAALTVTATDATRAYGDPNPVFTGTITGIKNADNITATFASTAAAGSAVGAYPITPSLVDPTGKLGNYVVTSNNGSLTITAVPLTVTAGNASRAYGDPNPAFAGTIIGLKNGDAITASYATTADALSPVGTYTISPALSDPTGKLANYIVTTTNGTLTIGPAALTVTGANTSRLYGDPNPLFTGAIAGLKNGDAITATFSSPATAASSVGSYAIVPTLADPTAKLSNYSVTLVNGLLTVSPAALSVAAADASRLYGDANPVFTGTITGLKNGDAITATFSSAAVASSAVGAYPITPTLLDPTAKLGNYTVTALNGTLTVGPAPLSASAANASRLYGDANPAFTGTITGLKNGDNITANFTSAADPTSAVGSYPIVASFVDPTGKLGNYTVNILSGTLTVAPAPLAVTAANATRVYGDPNPAFTGTITGLKNGDNITAAFTSADATAAVGTYPIVTALADPTAKLGNYTVSSSNGTLTITAAPLAVAAANASRLYGDPNPALTGTIIGLKNGDNITATYATTATQASSVGTFAIVPTLLDPGARLGNYLVTSTNGTLTIGPATLTVTAANASRPFGAANPVFTGSIAGIKNSDNITATFASAATAASPAGTFPIVPTLVDPAGKLPNYSVVANNGTLTVIGLPTPVSVTPNAGTTTSQIFSATFTDASTGTLTDAYMLINDVLIYTCGVRYHPATNQVFLINEAGTAWQPAVTLGSPTTLQNSKCVLNVGASSASVSGNSVTVNFSLSFTSTFVGLKNIYLRAQDTKNGLISPWTQLGTWSLPAPTPAVVSVTPNAGTSNNQIFTAVYSDSAGADKITDGYMLVNNILVWTCGVRYHPATHQLFMINEAGTAFQTPITIGTNAILQNSKCVLDGATSSASVSGNSLIVNFSLRFTATFLGNKNIYLRAADTKDNLQSPWTQVGTWTLASPIPSAISVTPNAGSGSSAIFSAVYSDTGGASSLTDAYMLINDTLVWTCGVRYHPATNQLFMINEAGTGFQTPVTMGTAATLQNSKCILDAATSSASVSGSNLIVNFSITFQPGFVGAKNIYLRAQDTQNNLISPWTQLGTWTLP